MSVRSPEYLLPFVFSGSFKCHHHESRDVFPKVSKSCISDQFSCWGNCSVDSVQFLWMYPYGWNESLPGQFAGINFVLWLSLAGPRSHSSVINFYMTHIIIWVQLWNIWHASDFYQFRDYIVWMVRYDSGCGQLTLCPDFRTASLWVCQTCFWYSIGTKYFIPESFSQYSHVVKIPLQRCWWFIACFYSIGPGISMAKELHAPIE